MEYKNQLYEEINIAAKANIADRSSEFINYVTNLLIDAEDIEDFTECYFECVGKRNKRIQIDGYNFDELDKSFSIFISEFLNESEIGTITNSQIDLLYGKMLAYVEHAVSGYIKENCEESGAGYELALELEKDFGNIVKFRFFILTDQVISKRVKSVRKEDIFDKSVELNVWDLTRLRDLEQAKTGKEEIEIDFENFSIPGLPFILGAESEQEQYRAYLMTIPGDVLASIYLEYGARLLEGNVRSFLSTKSKVNKEIRNTILTQPEMFFAYNNGIAATASDIEIKESGQKEFIARIKNLQIINGGQTTASIANAVIKHEGDIGKIAVPMKLSIVNLEKADSIIPTISRCANSQNKIDEADFASNHPFHVRMEEFSRKVLAPAIDGNQYQTGWFYERARGQYSQAQMKLSKAETRTFLLKWDKHQIIKKVDLAKYMNTYNQKPHIVSKGAQHSASYFHSSMVKEWDKADTQFNVNYFKKMVALAILFKHTERIISDQDWYKRVKSYRANIVTYSLAVLFHKIHKDVDKELDFKRIWNNQKIYIELEEQLIVTSKEVFDFITSDDRPTLNVTQWCKQELCWTKSMKKAWTILPQFSKTLIAIEEVREDELIAKDTQRVSNEVNLEMEVIKLGSAYWERMLKWADAKKMISPIDKDFIKLAVNIEHSGKIPSAKQAKRILTIRDNILLEGYLE